MRVGISRRGNAWVSMGPLGWLIFGLPYLAVLAVIALVSLIVTGVVALVRVLRGQAARKKPVRERMLADARVYQAQHDARQAWIEWERQTGRRSGRV